MARATHFEPRKMHLFCLLLLITFPLTTLCSRSVSWRLSVEGNTWQQRLVTPPQVQHRVPRDICSAVAHSNCNGGKQNDIRMQPNLNSSAACCAFCKATPGCAAWTYDTTKSHAPFCYAKRGCPNPDMNDPNAVSSPAVDPAPTPPPTPAGHIVINSSDTRHAMEGFGGCFNEKGWDALSALNATARTAVMEALFSPTDGLKYGINRMPIGSSDFADGYYSLDDSPGDYPMANLTLARDRKKLLPYIKAAMAVNPALEVWGSPWTGPEWLKDSAPQAGHDEGCGSLNADRKKRAAYALYLARAAKAYKAEGLKFRHLAIQNEPNQGGLWNAKTKKCGNSYPKMHWTGEQLREFLRDHLGPTFVREGLLPNRTHSAGGAAGGAAGSAGTAGGGGGRNGGGGDSDDGDDGGDDDGVGILLSTFPVDDFAGYVHPALSDPDARRYLAGVGLQYAGVGMIGSIRNADPALKTWETETPCGGGRRRDCGSGPGTRNNSWAWGEGQWAYMRSFIESGASVYSQWNMVLDQTGESGWGWSQCSPVTIDTDARTVTYEGSYWATKHFSYYVAAGARVLAAAAGGGGGRCRSVNGACGCAGGSGCAGGVDPVQLIGFRNPGGDVVVAALNAAGAPSPVRVELDGALVVSEQLPAHSMSTFVVAAAAATGSDAARDAAHDP